MYKCQLEYRELICLIKICTIFNIRGGHGHGEHEGHPDQVLLGDQRELDEGGPE